jgi:hypothetical protein
MMKRYLLKEWVAVCALGLSCLPASAQVPGGYGGSTAATWRSPYNALSVPVPAAASGPQGPVPAPQLAPPSQGPILEVWRTPPADPRVPVTDVTGRPSALGGGLAPATDGQAWPVALRLQFQDGELPAQPAPGTAVQPAATITIEAAEPPAPFPRAELGPARRSYVDLSAPPCFGHAADYSWLSGQVEYSRVSKEWRLRYASVDEPDRYGGHVVLIESQHVSYLEDGQYVHVRGHLVNPDADGAQAQYRIEAFEVIRDPNQAPGAPSPGAK